MAMTRRPDTRFGVGGADFSEMGILGLPAQHYVNGVMPAYPCPTHAMNGEAPDGTPRNTTSLCSVRATTGIACWPGYKRATGGVAWESYMWEVLRYYHDRVGGELSGTMAWRNYHA